MKTTKLFLTGIMVALITMSMCFTSCSDDFSNTVGAPQKKDTTKTDPTPTQPEKNDTTNWSSCLRKYHKVFETAQVESYLIGQRGGKDVNELVLDSLTLKYKYIYSLAADTTVYLEAAPTGDLSFTSAIEHTSYSEYSINAQKDSVCFINYSKPYYLSNGVNLSLTTQRMRGWHMMGGSPVMYSEPTQSVARLQIGSSVDEFERNDSIFGRRTNLCSVELTLGGQKFVPSCKVTEIWFSRLKETPEPSYNVVIDEYATFIAGSKCKVALNNWTDDFLFKGETKSHTIVGTPNSNGGHIVSYTVSSVNLSRVVMNEKVNGTIYDATTSLHIPAYIVPDNKDNNGWFTEGVIDGRSVEYDPTNARALEEGIKNFVNKDTSVPTPFFVNCKVLSTTTWKEYTYVTITWSKYSKDTDMITQTMMVKMPSK